jgi:predicted alpha/beta hydrolase
MSTVLVAIMAGLGTRHSNGIIIGLKGKLERIPGVTVLAGSYAEYEDFADALKNSTADHRVIIGHSLGGSVAPLVARMAKREITAVFGFDPADNFSANVSQYRLSAVPGNVRFAWAGYVEGGGLGGGQYVSANPSTKIENWKVPEGHLDVDDAIARHIMIDEFVKRLAEGVTA